MLNSFAFFFTMILSNLVYSQDINVKSTSKFGIKFYSNGMVCEDCDSIQISQWPESRYETPYKNGREHGMVLIIDTNEVIRMESRFDQGLEVGESKKFYSTGELHFVYPHKLDRIHGFVHEFYKNGVLKSEVIFEDNKPIGLKKCFSKDGKILLKGHWTMSCEKGKILE